jgi:two-component system OmpR family sensor kinase
LLMRRALRPLGKLASAAAEIERTSDPRRRLPQAESDDEIGRLAQTLNGMLSALERSREAERRFLADASHELRTPLTALVGNVDYLARHGATDELVAELEDDTRRIAKLADDLLVLSREEAAESSDEVVSLDELARETGEAVAAPPAPVFVRGDRAALERAVANLVENARRHGRGAITVEAAAHDELATLTVSDEGEGLHGDAAEHAFERFWRGVAPGAGSGLGLAIVHATAERHGGRAFVDGPRFTIELPRLRVLSETAARTGIEEPEKGSP